MNKIYTGNGDTGQTSLLDGIAAKDSLRVQTYGDIDEADSALGLARSFCRYKVVRETILVVQEQLKTLMAETASEQSGRFAIASAWIVWLESEIDNFSDSLTPLASLIIPGGQNGSPALHLARTVVRRAERSAVALKRHVVLEKNVIVYLNRLSDLCFVMARYEDEHLN